MPAKEKKKTAKKTIMDKPDVKKKRNILQEFSQELGLHLLKSKSNITSKLTVKTEDASPSTHGPKVVIFEDPTKRQKKIPTEKGTAIEKIIVEKSKKEEKPQLMSLKKVRHDVLKFGITGFEKKKKMVSKEQIAIRLGAIPRKKPSINYKLFTKMRQEEILKERQTRELKGKLGLKVKKPEKNKRPRDKNSVRGFDGQIGKYKDGFQVISKQDIRRIQQSGKKK